MKQIFHDLTFIYRKLDFRKQLALTFLAILQFVLGFIDFIGVLLIGLLGSLAVTGVQSKEPTTSSNRLIQLVGLQDVSFQRQVAILAISSVLLLLIKTIISIVVNLKILKIISILNIQLTKMILKNLVFNSPSVFRSKGQNELLHTITDGMAIITVGSLGLCLSLVSDFSTFIILSGGIIIFDPALGFSIILFFLLLGLLTYLILGRRISGDSTAELNSDISSKNILLIFIKLFREIKLRNGQKEYIEKFLDQRRANTGYLIKRTMLPNISKYIGEIGVLLGAVLISGIQFIIHDATAAVSGLLVFIAAGTRIGPAIIRLQQGLLQIRINLTAGILSLNQLKSLSNPNVSKQQTLIFTGKPFVPRVDLNSVFANYELSKNDVLINVDLKAAPGEFLAITGKSGSGKSTLMEVLVGNIDPSKGKAQISGTTAKEASFTWPGKISYVPQEVFLLDGTIRENLCIGLKEHFSDFELLRSLSEVGLLYELGDKNNILELMVGPKSNPLSGGQRQRLGIARALITNPKLLLLDEPTSALDLQSERKITEWIMNRSRDVTVIMISHRPSTLENADKIVLMSKGMIVASGKYEEILEKL